MFENAELYRDLINSIPDIIFKADSAGVIQFINAAVGILGYDPEQLEGKSLELLMPAEDVRRLLISARSARRVADNRGPGQGRGPGFVHSHGYGSEGMEVRLIPRRTVRSSVSDEEGSLIGELSLQTADFGELSDPAADPGFVGIIRDITRRRKAEELLRKLMSAVDQTPLSIIISDQDGIIQYINPQFIRTTGYSPDEVMGKNVKILKSQYHPKEFYSQMRSSLETRGEWHGEVVNRKKDGSLYWASLTISGVLDPAGNLTNFISIQEDITDKKRTAKQLKTLREKEVLLREIHHRVKNNLQIITSLVNLQTNSISDAHFLGIFRKFENRIHALALIHEKLYRSPDIAVIDFGDYMRSLVTHIIQRHCENPENIAVTIDCERIQFDIDTAIPAGLIVNELVTNAVLHAFEKGERGNLRVSLVDRENNYFLEVSDSGRGFPEGFDIRANGQLGLELVRVLADQLHGRLELRRTKGTSIQISIPYPE